MIYETRGSEAGLAAYLGSEKERAILAYGYSTPCGDFNAGVQFSAKTGLEVDVSRVACYATYSEEPLLRVDVAANLQGSSLST